jgi:hypothetical protein
MKKRGKWTWFGQSASCRAISVCAGLVIVGILILRQFHGRWEVPSLANAPLLASNGPAATSHIRMAWYVRSGQWQADLRSLVALLRYLEDSAEVAQTNPTPAKAGEA